MEEAATPLPSEETTPPVTNIYFGAIRVARASTFPALDCSYLSGLRPTASRRFQICFDQPEYDDDVHTIMGTGPRSVNCNSCRRSM